jgi:ankyrin repeat protein
MQSDGDGFFAFYIAAQKGHLDVALCLVKEPGADVNQLAANDGSTPLYVASQNGHTAVCLCLVKEFGANVNRPMHDGATPLYNAANHGMMAVVQCLVKELDANINQAMPDGSTPLMTASYQKHTEVVVWLIKHGADAQVSHQDGRTAADISRIDGAPAYKKAHTYCANPGCDGAGLEKFSGCLKVFFCGPACIWAHKAECKRIAAEAVASAGKAA